MSNTEATDTEDWVAKTLPVPSHWSLVSFEEVFQPISTSKIKTAEAQYKDRGAFPIVDQGQDFIGGYTDAEDRVINRNGAVIVFGDHTRCFKLITFPFAPGADGTKVLEPHAEVLPKFAYYGCLTLRLPDRGYSRHYSFLRSSQFPIAPLAEQRRIVAKIEELFSELDKGIGALTIAREQLKAYRQSVLKHAFDGKLTTDLRATHAAWRGTRLGDEIVYLTSGSRGWAEYYANSGDTFIRAQNLKYDRLDLTDIAFVQLPEGNTEGLRTRVKVGDVLITITGANVTKTGVVKSELGAAYVSQHVALCRPGPSMLPMFLYWYLLSEAHGRCQLNEAAYGAGKPGLNLDNIRSVAISLPSPKEQAIVVERIEAALSIGQELSESIDSELQRTHALRQSILKKAFSGQLVAQDAKDEPASVLLDRIRAERDAATTKTQHKTKRAKNGKKRGEDA
jgi:hypothetical protein